MNVNLLRKINDEVNAEIAYLKDPESRWQAPKETEALGTGDCEDIAALKCERLLKLGIDAYVMVVDASGTPHMVCCVDVKKKRLFSRKPYTDTYILDNIEKRVRFIGRTEYELSSDFYEMDAYMEMTKRR